MPKPPKPGKVDLELIGDAIRQAQKDLLALKEKAETSPKTKKRIDKKVKRLEALYAEASYECCDQQWYCPPSDDDEA